MMMMLSNRIERELNEILLNLFLFSVCVLIVLNFVVCVVVKSDNDGYGVDDGGWVTKGIRNIGVE